MLASLHHLFREIFTFLSVDQQKFTFPKKMVKNERKHVDPFT